MHGLTSACFGSCGGLGRRAIAGKFSSATSAPTALRPPVPRDLTSRTSLRCLLALLKLNEWGLSGDWTVGKEAVSFSTKPAGRIAYRFQGRDLNLIMGAAEAGRVRYVFRVLTDERPARLGSRRSTSTPRAMVRCCWPTNLPTDSSTQADRRADLRNRVPRARRRGLRVHLRLNQAGPAMSFTPMMNPVLTEIPMS